ncbi:Epsilon-sarcoglycan [Folsomia candida]|uniref:Epsilon-sarcoglycan n=1 Tax=Folsomia candida TaxID=158441 RepID=A0A226EPS9_FOLCA|nr:Epsilon-sarcoglycan [Folsomia candida]
MNKIIGTLVLVNALGVWGSTLEVLQQRVVVNSSELCILPITAGLLKWDRQPGFVNQVAYIPKLVNSPDLPSWLRYTYDGYNSIGYIYGVPPVHLSSVNLDIIGWNRGDFYDVRKLIISLEIVPKESMKYVAEFKVDNLNIKDMANPRRMGELVDILSDQLSWGNNGAKVVPIFMASAVALGENRVPVKPNEAEGVVVHFASDLDFSPELKKLQVEVQSLWKLRPCPRDLKRTSVERYFRKHNILVDWCTFRLTTLTDSSVEDVDGQVKKEAGGTSHLYRAADDESVNLPSEPEIFTFRSEIPNRTYGFEILLSTIIPGSIGGLVGFLLIVLDQDALFFEAAFRTLFSMLRIKYPRNGSQYIYHQTPQQDVGVVVMTRDNGIDHSSVVMDEDLTPIPPQYTETHPKYVTVIFA